jgi:hypothetical protein
MLTLGDIVSAIFACTVVLYIFAKSQVPMRGIYKTVSNDRWASEDAVFALRELTRRVTRKKLNLRKERGAK